MNRINSYMLGSVVTATLLVFGRAACPQESRVQMEIGVKRKIERMHPVVLELTIKNVTNGDIRCKRPWLNPGIIDGLDIEVRQGKRVVPPRKFRVQSVDHGPQVLSAEIRPQFGVEGVLEGGETWRFTLSLRRYFDFEFGGEEVGAYEVRVIHPSTGATANSSFEIIREYTEYRMLHLVKTPPFFAENGTTSHKILLQNEKDSARMFYSNDDPFFDGAIQIDQVPPTTQTFAIFMHKELSRESGELFCYDLSGKLRAMTAEEIREWKSWQGPQKIIEKDEDLKGLARGGLSTADYRLQLEYALLSCPPLRRRCSCHLGG